MKETKFKDTELGKIPEEWSVVTFEEIGVFSKGKGISRSEANSGLIPAIRYGEIYTKHHNYIKEYGSFISHEVAVTSRKLKKGDLLFTASGETKEEIGKSVAFISSEVAYAGGDIIILTPTREIDALYLGYASNVSFVQKQKSTKGQGDAVVHITTNSLKNIKLLVPSLAEQQRIASALSDADALVAELDVLIEKKRAIMAGTMQEFFTGKRRLQGFDEPWVDVVFGDKIKIYRGGSPRPIESYLTNNPNGLNWIKIGDARPGDKYITKTSEKIIPEGLGATRAVYSGDFLLSNSMSFGRPYILKIDGCIHDGWLSITEYQESFDRDFLYYLLGSDAILQKFKTLAAGSGVQNLNKKLVADMELQIPSSLAEQHAIATILSDMDAEIAELEAKRDKYKEVRQGMMQQLLTGKIRLI